MGMPRTAGLSALGKLTELHFELVALPREIAPVGDHKLFSRGSVLREGFFVRVDGLDEGSEQPADQDTRQVEPSRGDVHGDGAVRHHLRDVHLAPLPPGCRLEVVDAGDDLVQVEGSNKFFIFANRRAL